MNDEMDDPKMFYLGVFVGCCIFVIIRLLFI